MKKKQLKLPENPKRFSYFDNRKCHYCDTPIPDQARKNRIHCFPWSDDNGKLNDCKRKKHDLKHGREIEILQDHNARAKELNNKIHHMLTEHGEVVTTEILNAYNITLSFCDDFSFDGHILTTQFIDYTIVSNPITNTHEIYMTKHLTRY